MLNRLLQNSCLSVNPENRMTAILAVTAQNVLYSAKEQSQNVVQYTALEIVFLHDTLVPIQS